MNSKGIFRLTYNACKLLTSFAESLKEHWAVRNTVASVLAMEAVTVSEEEQEQLFGDFVRSAPDPSGLFLSAQQPRTSPPLLFNPLPSPLLTKRTPS